MWNFAIFAVFVGLVAIADADRCSLPRDVGNSACGGAGARSFFFHAASKTCQPFYYQGCDGNENRFSSKDECVAACKNAQPTAADAPAAAVCASGAYAAGATTGETVTCSQCPNGYTCENNVCCPTKEYTCALNYDAGKFGSNGKHTPRYFYSPNYKNCMLFTYYGRAGNANNFATYNECKNMCMQ
ncbi:unnamed protein product [Caenorhabditis bovis]|uniref:BPTI/Kunitz inhibitor domain-containing protein n=1 Tax=Caenorhabditis bovis TaxID=2654633 RepID=A0A8S1F7T1_9PELO|nr:unnamed protein product [Caenorhabditis bovis]